MRYRVSKSEDSTRHPACQVFLDNLTVMTSSFQGNTVDPECTGEDGNMDMGGI